MHLKAIQIKEKILGTNDYEIGLSVGHLASLYNYHMHKYKQAEELYHRSINISQYLLFILLTKLLFSDYSGIVLKFL